MLLLMKGNHKAVGIHKGRWPITWILLRHASWNIRSNKLGANTPVPDGGIFLSLFSDIKTYLKIGVVKLINEILDNTGSDDHPLDWRKHPMSASTLNSLQETLDTFQSLTYW